MLTSVMYRYRPINSILGKYKELENQEIYFASMEELNDPMEGLISPFYKGDLILWKGMLRFYFSKVFVDYIDRNYPGRYVEEEFATDILNLLLEKEIIKTVVDQLSKAMVHYKNDQIVFLFQYVLHPYIYWFIGFNLDNYFCASSDSIDMMRDMYEKARVAAEDIVNGMGCHAFIRPQDTKNAVEKMIIKIHEYIKSQWQNFYFDEKLKENLTGSLYHSSQQILRDFDRCIRPQFRIASFSVSNNNAALWGNYTNAQKGVCLGFNLITNKEKQTMKFMNNYKRDLHFHKVDYKDDLNDFDTAFNILGIMEEGMKSTLDHFKYKSPYLQKLKEWSYEEEYRLLIPDMGKEHAKVCYDFSALESITFGVNTSFEERAEVIDIVRNKANKQENRKKIKFYEFDFDLPNSLKQPFYEL